MKAAAAHTPGVSALTATGQVAASGRLRRLTIFLADLAGGGAERMMVALANGLSGRGITVDLLLARATGPYLDEVDPGVDVTDLRARGVIASLPALIKHLRQVKPDLLLTTLPHASAVALVARGLAGTSTPVVVREANTPTAESGSWSSFKDRTADRIMRYAYRSADGVIAVSDGVAEALMRVVGLPATKIAILYNPVVTAEIPSLAAVDPGHPWLGAGQPPVVLGVGSLSKRKDFFTLIRAFALVAAKREVRLIILGEGPERAGLENLVAELGLGDLVALPGFDANPFSYMNRAAVYVLSSNLEGLPGSLIQALACGCPSVATDCPSGPAEILQGGRLGPLVPVGDERAMAAAIEDQLDNPTKRRSLIDGVAKYDAATVLDAVTTYLAEISSRRRRAS